MTTSSWFLFFTISLITAFSPGPAILLAVTNAVSWGASRVMFSSLGSIVGLFTVSAAAMAGLGTLLHTSAWLFSALKAVGAVYLIYLGIKQWVGKGTLFDKPVEKNPEQTMKSNMALFRQGLLVSITNPKGILYFTALFPQFIQPTAPMLPQYFELTSAFALCALTSHLVYVLLARHLQRWFATPRRAKVFNRGLGAAFTALGLGLLGLKNPN